MANGTKKIIYQNEILEFPDNISDEDILKALQKDRQSDNPVLPEKNLYNAPIETIERSGKQFFSDLYQVIRHPVKTAKSIKDLGSSVINLIKPGEQGNEELAIAVGKFFKERYGGLENIKKTFRTDPVGFAADLSIILTGGAMLPARTTGTVGKFSKIIQATGNAIDPLTASLKVGSLAKKVPKYLGGSILDVVSGAKGGLTSANVVRAYDAGKTGGQTQEAFKIGKGGAVEATANIPVIGKMVENISGLRQNKAGFVQNLIDDLEKLKIKNRKIWNESSARNNLKKIKMSKKEITDILKNAEKNAKMNGVWQKSTDAKLFDTLKKMKDEIFKANINRNGLGADTYIQRINDLLKNNKNNNLLLDVKNNLKSNLNNKNANYDKYTQGFEEISKIENMADNIIADKNPDQVIKRINNIFKNNKTDIKLLKNLNPELTKNLQSYQAGLRTAPMQGNIVSSITKGAMGATTFGPPGFLLAQALGPRSIGTSANLAGKTRRMLTPNQKIQTGLGTSTRLARALQQKEDDTVYY
jgi:hypothetical protein